MIENCIHSFVDIQHPSGTLIPMCSKCRYFPPQDFKPKQCDHILGLYQHNAIKDYVALLELSNKKKFEGLITLLFEFEYCPKCAKHINKPDGYCGEY